MQVLLGSQGYQKQARPRLARAWRDRLWVRFLIFSTSSAALGILGYVFYVYALEGGYFRVKTIAVMGTMTLDIDAVTRQSGVTQESSVLRMDVRRIEEKVLAMPAVRRCTVTRVFPDKVVINIDERIALATLMLNNKLFEIDDEGKVLRELSGSTEHAGPFITNVEGLEYAEPGQVLSQPALLGALAVWRVFKQTNMAREVTVSEISALKENRISMFCDEVPCEIRWSRGNEVDQAKNLDVLWTAQDKKIPYIEYVDLRFGSDVVCK